MDYTWALKMIESLGISGLIILVCWKLLDRWAAKYLEVSNRQAEAMGELAPAVKEGRTDQHEILLAVRVLASKIDEQKEWLRELGEQVRLMNGTQDEAKQ